MSKYKESPGGQRAAEVLASHTFIYVDSCVDSKGKRVLGQNHPGGSIYIFKGNFDSDGNPNKYFYDTLVHEVLHSVNDIVNGHDEHGDRGSPEYEEYQDRVNDALDRLGWPRAYGSEEGLSRPTYQEPPPSVPYY